MSTLALNIVVATVALVLVAGLWNMLRGSNPDLSQRLMRWRVGLQFLAVLIVIAVLYLRG